MSVPRPFQKWTAGAAIHTLERPTGARRFLVADEVGLGKTVVAQEVIRGLMRGRRRPLVVFYFASDLSIAHQNRRKLLEVLEDRNDRPRGCCDRRPADTCAVGSAA